MHECCFHLISFISSNFNFQLTLSLILICISAYSDLRLHECGSFSSSQYVYLNVKYTPNTNFRYNSTWIYILLMHTLERLHLVHTVNRSYSSSFPLIRIGNNTLHMLSIILTMSYKPNRFHVRYSCMIFVFAEVQVERRFSFLVLDF